MLPLTCQASTHPHSHIHASSHIASRERKRIPYVGKHTKRIVSAVWNKDNVLAMAGQDRMVSVHGRELAHDSQAWEVLRVDL